MMNDITFCTFYDCKFFEQCKRYVYTIPDDKLKYVSVSEFIPKNKESSIPEEYCEFYKGGHYEK